MIKELSDDPLLIMRNKMAKISLGKAAQRIKKQKQMFTKYDQIQLQELFTDNLSKHINYTSICTQFGDTSSITRVKISNCGRYCVTAGSSGVATVWNIQNEDSLDFAKTISTLKGSTKLCDVDFHPKVGQIPGFAPNIVTGNTLGQINLWTFDPSLKQQKNFTLKAHRDRINCTKFHQSGLILLSASYDQSWSIWDCTKLKQISNQKGHQAQIHTLSLHVDGSMICTGSLDGYCMLWDLRTGKGIFQLEADNSVLCSDFHPNGYQIAISGKSNMINIFDIRRKKQIKCIPAHTKLISSLKYNSQGTVLFSGGHDNLVKLWHGRDYSNLEQQLEHPSKITSLDLFQDKLVTAMIDKKWTIWSRHKTPANFSSSSSQQNEIKQQMQQQ